VFTYSRALFLHTWNPSAILILWPENAEDTMTSVYGHFCQVFPILLATAASIGRGKLTLYEAHFSIAVTASPISIYLVYRAIYEAYKHPNFLHNISEDTKTTFAHLLSLILPILWLSLNIVISFSPSAFINSSLCKRMTLQYWLAFQVASNFLGALDVMGGRDVSIDWRSRKGLGIVSVFTMWVWGVYLVRHSRDIWDMFNKRRSLYKHRPFYFRWPCHVQKAMKCSWYVTNKTALPNSPTNLGKSLLLHIIGLFLSLFSVFSGIGFLAYQSIFHSRNTRLNMVKPVMFPTDDLHAGLT
jgi:hypothetical protein